MIFYLFDENHMHLYGSFGGPCARPGHTEHGIQDPWCEGQLEQDYDPEIRCRL